MHMQKSPKIGKKEGHLGEAHAIISGELRSAAAQWFSPTHFW
jgi:hypothetical protein